MSRMVFELAFLVYQRAKTVCALKMLGPRDWYFKILLRLEFEVRKMV